MDLTASIAPKSDQLNAEDFLTGPRTFTIESVTKGSAEQPFDFHLVEAPGRAYRPSKSMRRVLVTAWGSEGSVYAGRRLTLYRDPEVTFGRDKVGGIKISHLSDIDKPMSLALTVTRGKRAAHKVEPLIEAAPAQGEPTADQVAACVVPGTLRDWWKSSGPERRAQIEARVTELAADQPAADENPQWTGADA
jgi:hypothetical protein